MLAWLIWILVVVVAAVLLTWVVLIGVVVVGGMAGDELCPRCGLSFRISYRDRFFDDHLDPRYRSRARDRCLKCGWRRSDDGRA